MASQTKDSGFNRRLFLAGAAGGAMLPGVAHATSTSKKPRGIFADPTGTAKMSLQDKVADFSYQNDILAQLMVDMWTGLHAELITPSGSGTTMPQYQTRSANAKAALAARGLYLEQPIIITEDEYDDGFLLADAGLAVEKGVVFVLPRNTRPTTYGSPPLLETAKMLMAITPNGI
jgi:hypothetical protein